MAYDLFAHVKDVNSPRIRKVYIDTYSTETRARNMADRAARRGDLVWNDEDFKNPVGTMPVQILAYEVIEN